MRPIVYAAVAAVLVAGAAFAGERTAPAAAVGALASKAAGAAAVAACPAFLDREFRRLHSSERVNLCAVAAGRPVLLVNTASHCGFTSQFRGLQALHEKYGPRGLVVIGFPSDSFDQEADDAAKTAEVCYVNFGVKFTMVETTPVTGPNANAVFRELARQSRAPAWNFEKYLVAADGRVVQRFGSRVTPESPELTGAIEQLLR